MTSGGQGIRSGSKGQTRDRIVHAVIDALHDEGVAGISMPSTAARAQMSVRTLYRYFPSREALLAAALEQLLENVQPDMAVETARDLPVAFVEMADRLTRHPELANIVAGIGREVDLAEAFGREHCARVEALLAAAASEASRTVAHAIAPVVAFLSSPQSLARVAETSGCSPAQARDAVATTLVILVDLVSARPPAQQSGRTLDARSQDDSVRIGPTLGREQRGTWYPANPDPS